MVSSPMSELSSEVVFWRMREKRRILLVGIAMFHQRPNEGARIRYALDRTFHKETPVFRT